MNVSPSIRTIQVVNVRWFNATAWYGMELARMLNAAGHPTLTIGLDDTLSFAKAIDMGLSPIGLPLNTNNPLRMPSLQTCAGLSPIFGLTWSTATEEKDFGCGAYLNPLGIMRLSAPGATSAFPATICQTEFSTAIQLMR